MKLSEIWLREWVNPALTREQLGDRLTMSGLEVDALTPVADEFTGVVVAEVLQIKKHPEADKLKICEVNVGQDAPISIVCGASNVKEGMKVPAALIGAKLANNFKISRSKLRGVDSFGMLCSARELGLPDQQDGLMSLPQDAPLGMPIWDYLSLSDFVLDISITPNRGDCLSVLGLAKEISALTQTPIQIPSVKSNPAVISDVVSIKIDAPFECPRYVGRVIRQVKADVDTPIWMQERLRRSGQRCISPIVDVMNYVMLELGQPMHAFDLGKLSGDVSVRMATAQEELALLDGRTVKLDANTLVIADQKNPLAIAGVMGGLDSSVTLLTTDIFLESAFFRPACIARTGRHYVLNSESSYRFERGIDSTIQVMAIERATELLLNIVGGQAGPVIEVTDIEQLPKPAVITLSKSKITKLLGIEIPDEKVDNILKQLGFEVENQTTMWKVTVPLRRTDITRDVDLIEEIIRLYGYHHVKTASSYSTLQMHIAPENKINFSSLRSVFCDLGYNEVITYSFVDQKIQSLLNPGVKANALLNPMTADMSVMRTNLWSGLVSTWLYNQNRQQLRAKLFEVGLRFIPSATDLAQQKVIAGLVCGDVVPEQWGIASRPADFFDVKGDLQHVFKLTNSSSEFVFMPSKHPALHPGQSADIYRNEQLIGVVGALHPSIIQDLDIQGKIFVFELLLEPLEGAALPQVVEISKFPEIRRDLAILIDQAVPAQQVQDTIRDVAGELLKELNIFDMYQGQGIAPSQKSLAFSLVLQHPTRTLVDEEVAALIERVVKVLKDNFAAELRG